MHILQLHVCIYKHVWVIYIYIYTYILLDYLSTDDALIIMSYMSNRMGNFHNKFRILFRLLISLCGLF